MSSNYLPATGGVIGRTIGVGYPGNVSRSRDAIIIARPVSTNDALSIAFGSGVALNPDGTVSWFGSISDTLGVALTTTATTSLTLATGLPNGVQVGDLVTVGTNSTTVATAAAQGTTTVDVASFTPTTAYAIGTTVTFTKPVASFAGIAIREVKQATDYMAQAGTSAAQYYPGQPCDVLERGSATVVCQLGSPTAGGKVYIRVALNGTYPNAVIGGFEAEADGTNNVVVSNVVWKSTQLDATYSVAELTLLTRVAP